MRKIFLSFLFVFCLNASVIKLYYPPHDSASMLYASALRAKGFKLEIHNELVLQNHKPKIADKYQSFITGYVDGYFLEGHNPSSAIKWLIENKPKDVLGISTPALPPGALGLEQGYMQSYDVLIFYKNGKIAKYGKFIGNKELKVYEK